MSVNPRTEKDALGELSGQNSRMMWDSGNALRVGVHSGGV